MKNEHKLFIGIVVFEQVTAKYLSYFLPSLKAQTFKDYKVVAIDNSKEKDDENLIYIKNNLPEIDLKWAGKNLGFAKAYNLMIQQAVDGGAKYFLALNLDMILEPDMITRLFEAAEKRPELGSAAPKILRWNFKNNFKTKIIDTCGIKLLPGLRFVDLGQGQEDKGQFNGVNILGPSGAAAFYRISALEKVKLGGEYFDESMFMYKEDCDLAYRLFLAGFKSQLVSSSLAYHDRSVSGGGESGLQIVLNRKNKSQQAKEWSFLNQQLIFWKFWRTINWRSKLALVWYQIKIFIYILFFEPYLFKQLWPLYKIRKTVKIY